MANMDRNRNLARLEGESFDLLVIGGGATGAGVALDAASRGLKVALVERGDFASGTSSRSTKLVHGGVRYLEAAITQLDRAQFHLVREALAERAVLLHIAPHLVHPLRTVVPAYSWREVAMYRVGLWLYDRAAGDAAIGRSHFLSRAAMRRAFPRLRRHGLKGGVAYFDGQFDDARMAIALLRTAARESALVANYLEVTELIGQHGRLTGARVRDLAGDRDFTIRARAIVNATGPGSDALRRLEDPQARALLAPSRGTHLALDASWAPGGDGLLIPRTSDQRVLFLLPWQGRSIVGTTDVAATPIANPEPDAGEVDYLLGQLGEWLQPAPRRTDIHSRWAGLRPLIAEDAASTASLVREHHVELGPKGLVSIIGGKWTTYRLMAEETVDRVLETTRLKAQRSCHTRTLKLVGAEGYHAKLAHELATKHGLAADIACHLAQAYGDEASQRLAAATSRDKQRLVEGYPYLRAEVAWAQQHEMALTVDDALARRLRLAFLDEHACTAAKATIDLPDPPAKARTT